MVIRIPDRRILLPREVDMRLKNLADLNQETSGVLLYRSHNSPHGLDLHVDTLYMTGCGERYHVEIDVSREVIVNDFLSRHTNYKSIEWHTHVSGNRQLSRTDAQRYATMMARNPYFLAIVITQTGRTTAKLKNSRRVTTKIISTPQDFHTREQFLSKELDLSAKSLGLESLQVLNATRR